MNGQEIFEKLFKMNVNDRVEKKKAGSQELTYLSWAWAYGIFKQEYPDMDYKIIHQPDGKPYLFDPNLGYIVETEITAGGKTYGMWLPVMNSANKAMKDKPYTYKVVNRATGGYDEKEVEAATMFDINKTIMRCLVKNMAMFGLGLYIYAGEDLPEQEFVPMTEAQKEKMISYGANMDEVIRFLKVNSAEEISYDMAEKLIKAKEQKLQQMGTGE